VNTFTKVGTVQRLEVGFCIEALEEALHHGQPEIFNSPVRPSLGGCWSEVSRAAWVGKGAILTKHLYGEESRGER
jgi:hypothetical protein